jgi:hypothetical protein
MDFPHFVAVAVPDWGLGRRLDDMYAFHSHHGITAQRGQGRREGKQYYIRWCFADPDLAAAFAGEFKVGHLR